MRARADFGLMKRRINGKIVYYYWVYDDTNKRIYRSTGERTKAKALDYVLELREQGKLGIKDRAMLTLSEFCTDMYVPGKCPIMKNAEAHGRSITLGTCDVRRRAIDMHILPYLGKIPVSSLTKARINKWLIELPEKDHVSRSTANTYYDTLRQVMEEAIRQGIVASNPCDKVERLGSDSTRRKAFTLAEVRKIIGNPGDWDNELIRLMCLTSALTGMRLGEVRALKADAITDTAIYVKSSFSDHDGLKTPKNGEARVAPITPMLRDQLRTYAPKDGGWIFCLVGDKPISANFVTKSLQKRMKDVGIKEGSFHSFRATFNTELMADNVNETIIRKMIGHRSADMTEHYLHLETGEFSQVRKTQERMFGA